MAFDVSKFLALTVLIAGTGAACSGTDDSDNETTGGKAGSSTSGKAGQGNDAAGADAGGAGGTPAVNGGAGGDKTAAGAGGEALGGGDVGGAGGAPFVGECLGELAIGGAGGAGPDVEPSLEGLCDDLYDACPSAEAPVDAYLVCQGVANTVMNSVAVAVADCITALSETDICDTAKVTACYTDLQGRGCPNPDSAAACTAMKAREGCDAIDQAKCEDIADLIHPESFEAFKECMDPSIEGYYDTSFEGTCVERLDRCAGLGLL